MEGEGDGLRQPSEGTVSLFTDRTRWKVFCARCGHSHKVNADDIEIRLEIDKPCLFCGLIGCDAVVA